MRRENLGIANRNPLNIRHSTANRWLGLCPHRPNVKGFCHFLNFAYGYRAAVVLIKNYISKYGADTPQKIIARCQEGKQWKNGQELNISPVYLWETTTPK